MQSCNPIIGQAGRHGLLAQSGQCTVLPVPMYLYGALRMWLPVVDDSTFSETCFVDEHVIEAIVEVVPDVVLSHAEIEFIWIRGLPTDPHRERPPRSLS